jgi:hypothetical protein
MYGAAVACQTWRTWAAAKCNTAVQQVCMAAQQNRVVKFQRRVHLSVLVLNKRTSAPTPLLPQVENSETRRTQLLEAWAAPLRKYAASRPADTSTNKQCYSHTMLAAADVAATILVNSSGS